MLNGCGWGSLTPRARFVAFVISCEVSDLGPQIKPISPIEAHLRHLRAESSRQTKSNLWMIIQVIRELR